MHLDNGITYRLIALFFLPILIGGLLVLVGVDRNLSIFIVLPIILILLSSFVIKLIKIAKGSFFQYDEIFNKLGFHKRRLYLILTAYEKKIGDSTLRITYGASRASYKSVFNISLKLNCPNDLAIGYQAPIIARHLQEIPNYFSQDLHGLKLFANNPNWAESVFAKTDATNAIRNLFPQQSQHDSLSLINGQLLVRVLFNQVTKAEIQNLVESVETLALKVKIL
ncbi:hypothetical protein COV81_01530 [Candidatus Peregrinibacteria bacterium CG11_big_fil_rev_8_21_14_0_20_41_10]|nr:MAG: hypothetical protein COV81_01530 [Candidatus Peregrinibacteria bacterium CG11_big_fil_rev_8_21_14_0_20_41_10]PIZ75539.1 MAG: hypothetical protein COY06_02875 [Candidatus Peregrinibacteria bacterium CG_4_10_14_0_2_um_filter_41_8]PJC38348.1 MAG: hypothetical protein CO045_00710 [Candidatus Peregrinibacteria bacterium CG_4_9_14_0_2_um_filter_41_14]